MPRPVAGSDLCVRDGGGRDEGDSTVPPRTSAR